MFYYTIYDTRIGLFDSICAFQCILNVPLECIEPFNTVKCILYVPIVLLKNTDLIIAHYTNIMLV